MIWEGIAIIKKLKKLLFQIVIVVLLVYDINMSIHMIRSFDPEEYQNMRYEVLDTKREELYNSNAPIIIWDSSNPQKCLDEVEYCLSNLESEICIISDEVVNLHQLLHKCFWVDTYMVSRLDNDDHMYYEFSFKDFASKSQGMYAEIKVAAERILAKIPEDADEWTAAKIIHDELIRNIEYVKNTEHAHDLYGALVEKQCVCQGYSYAFEYLENLRGVECKTIISDLHAWNKITGLNSESCYLDVTWDDQDIYDKDGNAYISYEYFLLTKEEMESFQSHQSINDEDDLIIDASTSFEANYFKHENYYVKEYTYYTLYDIIARQYCADNNTISICFEDSKDFDQSMKDNYYSDILGALGYSSSFKIAKNWNRNIVTIYLYD